MADCRCKQEQNMNCEIKETTKCTTPVQSICEQEQNKVCSQSRGPKKRDRFRKLFKKMLQIDSSSSSFSTSDMSCGNCYLRCDSGDTYSTWPLDCSDRSPSSTGSSGSSSGPSASSGSGSSRGSTNANKCRQPCCKKCTDNDSTYGEWDATARRCCAKYNARQQEDVDACVTKENNDDCADAKKSNKNDDSVKKNDSPTPDQCCCETSSTSTSSNSCVKCSKKKTEKPQRMLTFRNLKRRCSRKKKADDSESSSTSSSSTLDRVVQCCPAKKHPWKKECQREQTNSAFSFGEAGARNCPLPGQAKHHPCPRKENVLVIPSQGGLSQDGAYFHSYWDC